MYVLTLLCIVLIVFEQKNVASTNLSNDKNQLQRIDDQIVETNDAYQERNHVKNANVYETTIRGKIV